jgi:hypothetical protein
MQTLINQKSIEAPGSKKPLKRFLNQKEEIGKKDLIF